MNLFRKKVKPVTERDIYAWVRRAAESMPHPWTEVDSTHLAAPVGSEVGWPVILSLCADSDSVVCATTFGREIERDWIQRRMALALLSMNNEVERGSFRIVEGRHGTLFALGERCKPERLDPSELVVVCETLVRETFHTVRRLYSQDVIDRGPEPLIMFPSPK